jgi:hypothetical protein
MTELMWEGKYLPDRLTDENGKKGAAIRIPLPFETIETMNERAQERQNSLSDKFSWLSGSAE